ncbi:MAG: hypothetical protein WCK67_00490 [bacterium]
MLFPIIGHIIGISWIFCGCYYIETGYLSHFPQQTLIRFMPLLILGLLLVLAPGFLLFMKAFWELLIAIISTILLSEDVIKGTKLKKLQEYSSAVKLKSKEYIYLLLLVSVLWLICLLGPAILFGSLTLVGLPIPFAIFGLVFLSFISFISLGIISIFISLSNQVFAFEKYSSFGYLKKSWQIVNNNFGKICGFIILFSIISILISSSFSYLLSFLGVNSFLVKILNNGVQYYIKSIINFFVVDKVILSQITLEAPKSIVALIINFVMGTLLLPFGSVCFTLLYQSFNSKVSGKKKKK